MKVQIVRQSGRPVDMEDAIKFDEEFKVLYDKAQEKAEALVRKKRFEGRPVMKVLERYLSFTELLLNRKYNQDCFVNLPATSKAWRKLIDKHGNIPVMVAKHRDKSTTVLVIMDSGI